MNSKEIMLIIREEAPEDIDEMEEYYKKLSYLTMRNQAMLEFQRKVKGTIEFPNWEHDETFRIFFNGHYNYVYFCIRNPTAIQQSVSISMGTYIKLKENGLLIVFAIPQAADPSYYMDMIPKSTDSFCFYFADSASPSYKIDDNIYYKLADLKML